MNATVLVYESESETDRKKRVTRRPPMPDAHADVALGDINDVCALIRMSPSWVHNSVSQGEFPSPVIRKPRCTRWRISDVREYIQGLVAKAASDPAAGEVTRAKAKVASAAAKAKREGAPE